MATVHVRIHGAEASFGDAGWISNDQLTERFLRAWCTPDKSVTTDRAAKAVEMAQEQYPAPGVFEVLPDEPYVELSQRPTSDEVPTEVSPQTTGQATPGVDVVE